ncbi:hypothetical protein A8709_13625 [Paenibacillus pectinilyticus]|uniref:PTS sugar transporter n=2 Tax=Paenibacillus pectinilyticus TaxID=512399 RepID=A0A1C1A570_9BACL|nr:hypothetical protein A8709_13625 [Paenibacillus pectinilyticus]
MNELQIILRGDDFGGSQSANEAIREACDGGLLKNVSVMAVGPFVEQAAELLAHRADICFGLHITMNAEWDDVKWGPELPIAQVPSLVDANGHFWPHPMQMKEHGVELAHAIQETIAQYEKLCRLGFCIAYVDEHMFFHYAIEGYREWLDAWCKQEGLINFHHSFRGLPEVEITPKQMIYQAETLAQRYLNKHICALETAQSGIYTVIVHPGMNSDEMRQFGNAELSGERIAIERDAERLLVIDPRLKAFYKQSGICSIRYDELSLQERKNVT